MQAEQILNASILDILFEGKNKEYGAYPLRRDYNRRLIKAISLTMAIITAGAMIFISNPQVIANEVPQRNDTIRLFSPIDEPEPPAPLPPPPPPSPSQPIKTIALAPPKIVADEQVPEKEKYPDQDELEKFRIDVVSRDGIEDDGLVIPPAAGKGVIASAEELRKDDDQKFVPVAIESSYPGGPQAWSRFLNKTFVYPDVATYNEIEGTVVVQFVVDVTGNVSDIEAVQGPAELREEAVRVIRKSGKWNPAVQNGRKVKSYKKQPIVFRLSRER